MEIRQDVSMAEYSTFKAGGKAMYFASVSSVEDITELMKFAREKDCPVFVLGNGSNVLFSDKGFDGLVIHMGKDFADMEVVWENDSEVCVEAKAGMMLSAFGKKCVAMGLGKVEFACGIPGSVGGAIYMNAGAYGGEMKDIVTEVSFLDVDGEVRRFSGEECEFGYRESFWEKNEADGKRVILSMRVCLPRADKEEVLKTVEELRAKRVASQPVEVPSAGSTFKRPEGYFAGKLIMDAGLKGFKLDESGAQVSPKHAGFVVNNEGKADASDIYRLICYVINEVDKKFGVRLCPEVRLIGFEEED